MSTYFKFVVFKLIRLKPKKQPFQKLQCFNYSCKTKKLTLMFIIFVFGLQTRTINLLS